MVIKYIFELLDRNVLIKEFFWDAFPKDSGWCCISFQLIQRHHPLILAKKAMLFLKLGLFEGQTQLL